MKKKCWNKLGFKFDLNEKKICKWYILIQTLIYFDDFSAPCPTGEKCRSFTACAAQNSLKDGKNCKQNDGSRGMCCKSINKNVNCKFDKKILKFVHN